MDDVSWLDNVKCTFVFGHMKLKPVEYWIESRADGAYIVCEFSSLGPISDMKEAMDIMIAGGGRFVGPPDAATGET